MLYNKSAQGSFMVNEVCIYMCVCEKTPFKSIIQAGISYEKIVIVWHIQFINDVSDVLHPLSGYNSDLRNFNLKKICIINTPYGNKTIIISWLNM